MTTLTAPRDQQRRLQRLRDRGLTDTRRVATRGSRFAARMVATYQGYAIAEALAGADDVLAEQGLSTARDAAVAPESLLTGAGAAQMLDQAQTDVAFDRLVSTLIFDAARSALAVDSATRPAAQGHVRQVNAPCCGRCAVLAGRFYRYSDGFQRHPKCDCLMVPSTQQRARSLTTDPGELFRSGQIRGLSRADTQALNDGADLAQVVNVRRKQAGLVEGSSVLVRSGRPTPEFVIRVASDREERLTLLRRFGYIT